nr:CoA transferase [Bradyrhizobium sp. CCBAU 11430]
MIKIERPCTGDDARALSPRPRRQGEQQQLVLPLRQLQQEVGHHQYRQARGQAIIRELAKDFDVFMENYKVGDLKRYGLDYESTKVVNPSIIYCSVTAFGETGPYAPRAGYDAIFQAMGRLMSVTRHMDGEPGGGPMKVGPPLSTA